jgi:pilus assembly protein CpaE
VKGGCGATTLACHAAAEMQARSRSKTLVADLDFDCGIVRFLMQSASRYSIVDAMTNLGRLDTTYWSGLVSSGRQGLDVIAAPGYRATGEGFYPRDLQSVLKFTRSEYPFVIADLGRGMDELRLQALHEVDDLVLVSTLDVAALHRATTLSRQILDSGFRKSQMHFVVNRVPRNTDVEIEDVEKVLGMQVYAAIVDDHAPLEAAYRKGRLLAPEEPLRRRIGRLADKLTGVERPAPAMRKKRKFAIFSFEAKEATS